MILLLAHSWTCALENHNRAVHAFLWEYILKNVYTVRKYLCMVLCEIDESGDCKTQIGAQFYAIPAKQGVQVSWNSANLCMLFYACKSMRRQAPAGRSFLITVGSIETLQNDGWLYWSWTEPSILSWPLFLDHIWVERDTPKIMDQSMDQARHVLFCEQTFTSNNWSPSQITFGSIETL